MQAAAAATQPAIIDLTAVEAQGLSAQFFLTDNTSLPPDQTVDNVPSLTYAAGSTVTLPAGTGGGKISGIWSGYLDCPQDGNYNLSITADAGAAVTLLIGGTAVTWNTSGNVWTNSSTISLTAGNLTSFVLSVSHLTATLSVSWQTTGMALAPIPGQYLYSQTILSRLASSYTRYLKGASLATALALDANELAFLAQDADLQVAGVNWLNALTITGSPTAANWRALGEALTGLLTFAHLKGALSPSDERFLTVVQNPTAILPNKKSAPVHAHRLGPRLIRRAAYPVLRQQFACGAGAHREVRPRLRRLRGRERLRHCRKLAAPRDDQCTSCANRHRLRGRGAAPRYAETDWLNVIKPINDTMRQSQRDALVPYVLQLCAAQNAVVDINTPVNTADTLFEYLLIDVEMQPCMLTSRIRLAALIGSAFHRTLYSWPRAEHD